MKNGLTRRDLIGSAALGALALTSERAGLQAAAKANKDLPADGVYTINSVFNGERCLDMPTGNVDHKDDEIHQYNCNGGVTQHWRVKADPDRPGRYTINWEGSGKYLQPDGHSNDDGATIHFHERENNGYQAWRINPLGDDQYIIINDGSTKAIDFWSDHPDPGGPPKQKSANPGVAQQRWRFTPV